MYVCIYIYIYINHENHENNVPSRLPQWLCSKVCLWAHDVWLQHCSLCAEVHELLQSHCGYNREDALFL